MENCWQNADKAFTKRVLVLFCKQNKKQKNLSFFACLDNNSEKRRRKNQQTRFNLLLLVPDKTMFWFFRFQLFSSQKVWVTKQMIVCCCFLQRPFWAYFTKEKVRWACCKKKSRQLTCCSSLGFHFSLCWQYKKSTLFFLFSTGLPLEKLSKLPKFLFSWHQLSTCLPTMSWEQNKTATVRTDKHKQDRLCNQACWQKTSFFVLIA